MEMRPDVPRKLLWRVTDPVPCNPHRSLRENGKKYLYCDFEEVEKLKGHDLKHLSFLGTDEEWKRFAADWNNRDLPRPGTEHLWEIWPDKSGQKRAAELIKALDEYRADDAHANDVTGCKTASEACNNLTAEMSKVFDRMLEIRANTIEGFRAQAIASVTFCHAGQIFDSEFEDEKMVARMLSALTGVSINAL